MVLNEKHAQAPLFLLRELRALCVKIPIPPIHTAPQKSRALSPAPATLTGTLACKTFACRSFRNTGGYILPAIALSCFFRRSAVNSFRIRTYEKTIHNPFRIRTYKTQELKSFRIRTYKKTGGGPKLVLFPPRPKRARNIQVLSLSAFHSGNALMEKEN